MTKLNSFFNSKRVLLTGHTGFKGSWMSAFLHELGAVVQGYSLDPKNPNDLFFKASIFDFVNDLRGDILDIANLKNVILTFRPEVVFHFAAQPLVIESYMFPKYTWEVNVMGTLNLLDCLRDSESVKSIVIVTTDKVYMDLEKSKEYKEEDRLGGFDPYSSSKAAVEVLVDSMYNSFFKSKNIGLATARSGNVIGGGDWSENRLIPDYYRSYFNNASLDLRNPSAVRPWQHVLDVINGYSILGMKLYKDPISYSRAWNFGPLNGNVTTKEVIDALNIKNNFGQIYTYNNSEVHETKTLRLNSSKSNKHLGWQNLLSLDETLNLVNFIYLNYYENNLKDLMKDQIRQYLKLIESP